MRLLELHCDYINVKPKTKALKTIADLGEEEKKGLRMENVMVVFSSFEEGDNEEILEKAKVEVEKNFKEVHASAILVYPYAHLSPKLAKPSLAQALLESFLLKVKSFAPNSRKSPFGWYKEFELKCKGHPLAELSKTIGMASAPTPSEGAFVGPAEPVAAGASAAGAVGANDTYRKLIGLLDKHHAHYRLIDHAPEGRTEVVSPMRGNAVSQAAKCIVVMVKLAKKETKYVLAVVPGDARVDLDAVKQLFDGTYVSFATADIAEKLAGSVMGTVLPFSFHSDLELVVDPLLLKNNELFFNAARLDQSLALKTADYVEIAKPRLEKIAKPVSVSSAVTLSALEKKVTELGAKDSAVFMGPSIFENYGGASPKNTVASISLEAQRNTAALLLAHSVQSLFGGSFAVAFGKDNEVYADFDCKPLNASDLEALEKQMQLLRSRRMPIKAVSFSRSDAEKRMNKFQKEALQESGADKILFAEFDGKMFWLPGPFAPDSGKAVAFTLSKFGGSYWKNNASQAKLQRVHVLAFASEKALSKYKELQKQAELRDHRKIGKAMDLFSVHEEGVGFIFFHPNGMIIFKELEKYIREQYHQRGYSEVRTPIIMNEGIWHQSGHWDHYKENMYFTSIDGVPHAVKPMNCPGGMLVYKTRPRSYRELPLRFAEHGIVHRHELSGVLSGLFRVRSFTQDDAHHFVTEDQIVGEVKNIMDLMDSTYSMFGFDYHIELSTKPEKAMGDPALWEKAETALKKVLDASGKKYGINEGVGAFYGPKIDFKIKDALGREWQCGTIQLDFQMPERFDLNYEGSDGKRHRPVMLHRVIYGSFERFIGVLTEHFAGAFPVWLAPEQVRILPLTDNENEYAEDVKAALVGKGIRVSADLSSGKIEGKVRDAQLDKVPYMLVVGAKEREAGTISVRRRDGSVRHGVKPAQFAEALLDEIGSRRLAQEA